MQMRTRAWRQLLTWSSVSGWLVVVASAGMASLFGASATAANLDDGLVGYWSLNEGDGTVAHDSSRYGNDGSIVGATWTTGISGPALYFDGVDDHVSILDHSSLDVAEDITLVAWMCPYSMPSAAPVFSKGTDSSNYGYYSATGSAYGNRANFQLHSTGTATLWLDSSTVLQVGQWYHVVAVRSGTTAAIYVNGEPSGIKPCFAESIRVNDLPLYVGTHYGGGIRFHGVLDELCVFNRALADDEIAWLFAHPHWGDYPDPQPEYGQGNEGDASGTSQDPVNTATGNFFYQETDRSFATRGGLTAFTRYYNSAAAVAAARSRQLCEAGTLRDGRQPSPTGSVGPLRPTDQDTSKLPHGALVLGVGVIALPCVGLGCWLVQRRLRAGTRTPRSRLGAEPVQKTINVARRPGRDERRGRARGRTHGRSTCLQGGGRT